MPAPSEVAAFLGERRKFALTLEQAELMEGALDCGVFLLEAIFRARQQRIKHVQKILTHALIGGGMDEEKALGLVEHGVKAGSLLRYADLCHVILVNFLGPLEDEGGDGKKQQAPQSEGGESSASDQEASSLTEE